MKLTAMKNDRGMGLIELIVYSALTVVVLSVVGGILITILTVQRNVVNGATTAEQAQLIAETVESGVRNATAIQIENFSSGDQMVTARSAKTGSTITWSCLAWYFTANSVHGGNIRYLRSNSAIVTPNSSELSNWTLLGEGVSPVSSTPVFSLAGTSLSLQFSEQVESDPAVTINSTSYVRGGPWKSDPCF